MLPSIKRLDVGGLLALRAQIDVRLSQMRRELEDQLSRLPTVSRGRGTGKAKTRHALRGRKIGAQFRSKKNPKLTWAGRGMMPTWMREEMKGTKLKKEDFRIK